MKTVSCKSIYLILSGFLLAGSLFAHDKVVVIPLGGEDVACGMTSNDDSARCVRSNLVPVNYLGPSCESGTTESIDIELAYDEASSSITFAPAGWTKYEDDFFSDSQYVINVAHIVTPTEVQIGIYETGDAQHPGSHDYTPVTTETSPYPGSPPTNCSELLPYLNAQRVQAWHSYASPSIRWNIIPTWSIVSDRVFLDSLLFTLPDIFLL